jgi:hypothetical protein
MGIFFRILMGKNLIIDPNQFAGFPQGLKAKMAA